MTNCKITLKALKTEAEIKAGYSHAGLTDLFGSRLINPNLKFDRVSLIRGFIAAKNQMSISGAQPKRSAVINGREVELTATGGQYILKPSPEEYPFLAEIEHTSMLITKALATRLKVAHCGLVTLSNGELAYITKRYDRSEAGKHGQEQLDAAMGKNDKYDQNVSYERIGQFILSKVKVPLPALMAFFEQVVISYLIANNDLHIRNLSILVNEVGLVTGMTPAYDMLAAGLYIKSDFLALPLTMEDEEDQAGSTKGIRYEGFYTNKDFIELGTGIGLNEKVAKKLLESILSKTTTAIEIVKSSYMPERLKAEFIEVLLERGRMLK